MDVRSCLCTTECLMFQFTNLLTTSTISLSDLCVIWHDCHGPAKEQRRTRWSGPRTESWEQRLLKCVVSNQVQWLQASRAETWSGVPLAWGAYRLPLSAPSLCFLRGWNIMPHFSLLAPLKQCQVHGWNQSLGTAIYLGKYSFFFFKSLP